MMIIVVKVMTNLVKISGIAKYYEAKIYNIMYRCCRGCGIEMLNYG